jgi:hypothetical protein
MPTAPIPLVDRRNTFEVLHFHLASGPKHDAFGQLGRSCNSTRVYVSNFNRRLYQPCPNIYLLQMYVTFRDRNGLASRKYKNARAGRHFGGTCS